MGFNQCDNCGGAISWDKQRREALGTKRPLNHDGTIHSCGGNGMRQQVVQQHPKSNPIQQAVDQKSQEIKAAQEERRQQHRELIIAMQNLTKAIIRDIAIHEHADAADIEDSIGFDQYREDQRSFQDEVV
jgi:hypothetical protein